MPTLLSVSRGGSRGALVLWAFAIVAALLAARYFDAPALLRTALEAIARLGAWGPVLFALLYVAATVLFLPGSILTLGADVVFGLARGAVIVSISATLGATAAFLVGRYVARAGWPARSRAIRSSRPSTRRGPLGLEDRRLTRLSPVFPFNLLNYAFGLTRVSLSHYVIASWIGMMPGTVMYVYLGSVAGTLAGAGGGTSRTPAEWALYAVGLAATIGVTVYVTRLARRALARRAQLG